MGAINEQYEDAGVTISASTLESYARGIGADEIAALETKAADEETELKRELDAYYNETFDEIERKGGYNSAYEGLVSFEWTEEKIKKGEEVDEKEIESYFFNKARYVLHNEAETDKEVEGDTKALRLLRASHPGTKYNKAKTIRRDILLELKEVIDDDVKHKVDPQLTQPYVTLFEFWVKAADKYEMSGDGKAAARRAGPRRTALSA